MSEHHEQAALVQWAKVLEGQRPELALLYAVPNGGHRHRATAAKLKAEGVKAGVPDLCLPVARGGYHGLYIEMKWADNKPTADQAIWLARLQVEGYATAVCWNWEAASEVIMDYLDGRMNVWEVEA